MHIYHSEDFAFTGSITIMRPPPPKKKDEDNLIASQILQISIQVVL